jgi:hypothetical protein
VSDPERNRALVRLRDRYVADDLSIEEFSHSLDSVLAARTHAELQHASPDVPPSPASDLTWHDAESLQHHLPAGEEILWTGRPATGISLPAARGRLIVIGLWLFIVVVGNATSGTSISAVIGGLLIAAVVVAVALRRFVFTSRSRRRVLYVVTTARVARVVRARSGEQMDSILLRAIPAISVRTARGERGTISFGQPTPAPTFESSWSMNSRRTDQNILSFANVPDAVHVARLISTLQAHEHNPSTTGRHLKKR